MIVLEYAASFFLLGGELKDATNVCVRHLQDYQLAITICRLYEGDLGTSVKVMIRDVILSNAIETGNMWLTILCHSLLNQREDILDIVKTGKVAADFASEMLLRQYENSVNSRFLLSMAHEYTKKELLPLAFSYLEKQAEKQNEESLIIVRKIVNILSCSVNSIS